MSGAASMLAENNRKQRRLISMKDWRQHLLPHESKRLQELDEQAEAARKERRRIWDRCRKREAKTKAEQENRLENQS